MIPKVENEKLIYKKALSRKELPVSDIVWVYLQIEEGTGGMCCGQYDYKIYRVVVHTASGEILKFQYENEKTARSVFDSISSSSSSIDVGFTPENKKKYL